MDGVEAEKDKMLVEKQKVIEELTWKLHQEQRQVSNHQRIGRQRPCVEVRASIECNMQIRTQCKGKKDDV